MGSNFMLGIDLSGRIFLVTGGNRGIGQQIGQTLALAGATVVLTARTESGLGQIEAGRDEFFKLRDSQAEPSPGTMTATTCDVTDPSSVKSLFQLLHQTHGRLDGLVANAGVLQDSLLGMASEEQFERTFAVNTIGTLRCCQYASRLMARRKRGVIILLSSIMGRIGNVGQSVYAASKAGVIGMGKSLAQELAPHGIRVNMLAPGLIDTDMTRGLPAEKRAALLQRVSLGRIGTAQDVANVALFLASDLSEYVNGQVIGVDGGWV
jgi:3-oxoacyl-[acyl-carrier protein] reductase